MVEPPAPAAPPVDPELLGVPLSAYAAVVAYLGEGIPLEQGLAHAAISADAWPALEAGWSERLVASATGDGELLSAYDKHRIAAALHVERALPPLDVDLPAWLDFYRAFTTAEEPLGFLEARELTEADIFRLLGFWEARMASEEGLRREAAEILARAPGAAPQVLPRPPTLKAATRRRKQVPGVIPEQ